MSYERKFWGVKNKPYYFITLIPWHDQTPIAPLPNKPVGGVSQHNMFVMFRCAGCSFNAPVFDTLSHEYFHNWNSKKIFKGLQNSAWVKTASFIEGFTNYYGMKFNLRLGIITPQYYIDQYNTLLNSYYHSGALGLTSSQFSKIDMWKDLALERYPYQQGEILAHNWNATILSSTHHHASLDTMMKQLINGKNPGKSNLTFEKMDHVYKNYTKTSIFPQIQSYINNGKVIVPNKNSLGSCVDLVYKNIAPYTPGLDVHNSKQSNIISGVQIDTQAYKAGLRNGQKLLAIKHYSTKINDTMLLEVSDHGHAKVIHYQPYLSKLSQTPQFEMNAKKWKAEPKQCLKELSE